MKVHTGVSGFISDENNNLISGAEIKVDSIKHVVHSEADGDYWRLLAPGTYTVSISATG